MATIAPEESPIHRLPSHLLPPRHLKKGVITLLFLNVSFLVVLLFTAKSSNFFLPESNANDHVMTANLFLTFLTASLLYLNYLFVWLIRRRKPWLMCDGAIFLIILFAGVILNMSPVPPLPSPTTFSFPHPNTTTTLPVPPTPLSFGTCTHLQASKLTAFQSPPNPFFGTLGCSSAFTSAPTALLLVDSTLFATNEFGLLAATKINELYDDAGVTIPDFDQCSLALRQTLLDTMLPPCDAQCNPTTQCQSTCSHLSKFCGPMLDNWVLRDIIYDVTSKERELLDANLPPATKACFYNFLTNIENSRCLETGSMHNGTDFGLFEPSSYCEPNQIQLEVDMISIYESGWANYVLRVQRQTDGKAMGEFSMFGSTQFPGGSNYGYLCLDDAGSYAVTVTDGVDYWADTVTWRIRTNGRTLIDGGAPVDTPTQFLVKKTDRLPAVSTCGVPPSNATGPCTFDALAEYELEKNSYDAQIAAYTADVAEYNSLLQTYLTNPDTDTPEFKSWVLSRQVRLALFIPFAILVTLFLCYRFPPAFYVTVSAYGPSDPTQPPISTQESNRASIVALRSMYLTATNTLDVLDLAEDEIQRHNLPSNALEHIAKDDIIDLYVVGIAVAYTFLVVIAALVGAMMEVTLDDNGERHPNEAVLCYAIAILSARFLFFEGIVNWHGYARATEKEYLDMLHGVRSPIPGLNWWRSHWSLAYNGRYSLIMVVAYEQCEILLQIVSFLEILANQTQGTSSNALLYAIVLTLNCFASSFFISNHEVYGVGSIASSDVVFEILYVFCNWRIRGNNIARVNSSFCWGLIGPGTLATLIPLSFSVDVLNDCVRRHYERRIASKLILEQLARKSQTTTNSFRMKRETRRRLASLVVRPDIKDGGDNFRGMPDEIMEAEDIEKAVHANHKALLTRAYVQLGSFAIFCFGLGLGIHVMMAVIAQDQQCEDLVGECVWAKIPEEKKVFFTGTSLFGTLNCGFHYYTLFDAEDCDLNAVPDVLEEMVKLNEIKLNGNNIASLPSYVWNLESLYLLELDGNPVASYLAITDLDLTELPPVLLNEHQTDLRADIVSLDLGNNSLSDDIFGTLTEHAFTALKELYISHNDVKSSLADPQITALIEKLDALDLSFNRVPEVTVAFAVLMEAKAVNLEGNPVSSILWDKQQLAAIPSWLKSLGSCCLEKLVISRTSVSALPPGIFDGLGKLKTLTITENVMFDGLDNGSFTGLSSIESIALDNNGLKLLPADAFSGCCGELKSLSLSYNSIGLLEDGCFASLGELTDLDLKQNNLTEFRVNMFAGLEKLETLRVAVNPFNKIEPYAFQGLASLKKLWISVNDQNNRRSSIIRELPRNSFEGLHSLVELRITGLAVDFIDVGVFSGLRNVEVLIMQDCLTRRIMHGAFDEMDSLRVLELSSMLGSIPGFDRAHFRGIADTLEILELSGQALAHFEPSVFGGMNLDYLGMASVDAGYEVVGPLDERNDMRNNLNYLHQLFKGLEGLRRINVSPSKGIEAPPNLAVLFPGVRTVTFWDGDCSNDKPAAYVGVSDERCDVKYNCAKFEYDGGDCAGECDRYDCSGTYCVTDADHKYTGSVTMKVAIKSVPLSMVDAIGDGVCDREMRVVNGGEKYDHEIIAVGRDVAPESWSSSLTRPISFDCEAWGWDGGDCVPCEHHDCSGAGVEFCADDRLGDGVCDVNNEHPYLTSAYYGKMLDSNFNCAENDYDGGDCCMSFGCDGTCVDVLLEEGRKGDGQCDAALDCTHFNRDEGDCACAQFDCSGSVCADDLALYFRGDLECDNGVDTKLDLNCAVFNFDDGDCTEDGLSTCMTQNGVYAVDCAGKCIYSADFIFETDDGFCDDGIRSPYDLMCDNFYYDWYDCETDCNGNPIGDFGGRNPGASITLKMNDGTCDSESYSDFASSWQTVAGATLNLNCEKFNYEGHDCSIYQDCDGVAIVGVAVEDDHFSAGMSIANHYSSEVITYEHLTAFGSLSCGGGFYKGFVHEVDLVGLPVSGAAATYNFECEQYLHHMGACCPHERDNEGCCYKACDGVVCVDTYVLSLGDGECDYGSGWLLNIDGTLNPVDFNCAQFEFDMGDCVEGAVYTIAPSASPTSPAQAPTVSDGEEGEECAPDVAGFKDEGGYSCWQWDGYSCDTAQVDEGFSAAGEAELLENCKTSCRSGCADVCPCLAGGGDAEEDSCAPDMAGYTDNEGYSCSDWAGYACANAQEDYAWSPEEEAELLENCKSSCKTDGCV